MPAPILLGLLLGASAAPSLAQDGAPARSLAIEPSVAVGVAATNNRDLTATDKRADVITTVSPGVRITSRRGAVQGTLDYELTGELNARNSEANEIRHRLAASIVATPVENRVVVNARASLSQQTISSFGLQTGGADRNVGNRTQTGSVGITPSVRGSFGGLADYQLSVARDIARAKDTSAGDSDSTSASALLSGRVGNLGWGLEGTRQQVSYRLSGSTTDDRAIGSLSYQPDVDLRLAVRAGIDRSDALGGGPQRKNTYGAGLQWTPTERTVFALDGDKRFFGNSHSFLFQHRMKRSAIVLSDSRSATSTTGTLPGLTAYQLTSLAFASDPRFRDNPAALDRFVRTLLAFQNIDPSLVVTEGFLTTSRSLARRQELSYTLSGLRSGVSFGFARTETRRLDAIEGFSQNPDIPVRQLGFTLSLTHKLTPSDSLTLLFSQTRTDDTPLQLGNETRITNLTWLTQPGQRVSLILNGRYAHSEGLQPYNEAALSATLRLQF